MRQIPSYLIVGSGRIAKHFSYYFHNENIKFNNWTRSSSPKHLQKLVKISDVVILAIKDDAIIDFIKKHPIVSKKILFHCSGTLSTDKAKCMHPLLSFGEELYDVDVYKTFPFIVDFKTSEFKKYFPNLPNPIYFIPQKDKAYYHALCVMSGNFTSILWSKLFSELENRFNIPKEAGFPYLTSIAQNLFINHKKALTGPLTRKDKTTIEKNLAALDTDCFLSIYQAFIELQR